MLLAFAKRVAHRFVLVAIPIFTFGSAAEAACTAVAGVSPVLPASYRLAAVPPGHVSLAFMSHASFLIESPGGVTIVTDYNDAFRPHFTTDVVTMNHAHPTHYSNFPDPGIKHVLRGWDEGGGVADIDVTIGDVRIRNVPTNIRDFAGRGIGGTEFAGNSIFVFDVADLCIAHLSHLHHTLTEQHLAELGPIDVLLAPVDGSWTLSHDDVIEVIGQIRPAIVIPMHYFSGRILEMFLARLGGRYSVHRNDGPALTLTRAKLPRETQILILPGS